MAGFEVVVRPSVFPNIRPVPPRVLPPQDDPTQGITVISGSSGKIIDLTRSFSVSMSRQKPQKETARQFNVERAYQKEEKGGEEKINKNNYIDFERLRKVRTSDIDSVTKMIYADPPSANNVETLRVDVTRNSLARWVFE